mgnify:CR=1 FL=1|jgi:hypothetical protein
MRKRLSLKTRRRDLSAEVFRAHYEYRHIPMGLAHVGVFQWRKYVRNYIQTPLEGEPYFDCVTEFWTADDYDDALLQDFVKSEAFQPLDQDDHLFLDITKRFSLDLKSEVLAGATEPEGSAKTMLLWRAGSELNTARNAVAPVVEALADRTLFATLDVSRSPSPDAAPFDCILTLWTKTPLTGADFIGRGPSGPRYIASIESVETPRAQLFPGAFH